MKSVINILLSIALLSVITSVLFQPYAVAEDYEVVPATIFSSTDERGVNFSLNDYKGDVILLHFTGLETPLCIECFDEMKGQIQELENLSQLKVNTTIITINIRKNPFSDSGMMMAESDFGVNVNWHWVEDYSPYPIAGLYQEYWTVDGAFSNPALLMINQNFSVVGVYHVYCLGKGPLDGIQTANSLSKDISDIQSGNWGGFPYPGPQTSIFIRKFLNLQGGQYAVAMANGRGPPRSPVTCRLLRLPSPPRARCTVAPGSACTQKKTR